MTATMTNITQFTVAGIEDSDGERCECCGTRCPKRRIVLMDSDGSYHKYGSSCASFAITGKKAGEKKKGMELQARAIQRVNFLAERGHDKEIIANDIHVRFAVYAKPVDGGLELQLPNLTPDNSDPKVYKKFMEC